MKATLNAATSWTGSSEAIWTAPPRIKPLAMRCRRRTAPLRVRVKERNHERASERFPKAGAAGGLPAPVVNSPNGTAERNDTQSIAPLDRTSACVPSTESPEAPGKPPAPPGSDFAHTLSKTREVAAKAWESVSPSRALRSAVNESLAGGRHDLRLLLCVAVVAAQALAVGIASVNTFVTHWKNFSELISKLLG